MSTFGERVKILRKDANITQDELAQRVGLAKQNISKIERGKTKFTSDELIKRLSFALSCTPDYLLGLTEEKTKLKNGLISPISIDPQHEIKSKILDTFIDQELAELFIKCNVLPQSEKQIIKRIIKSLVESNE